MDRSPTVAEMEADCRTAFVLERARLGAQGIEIPDNEWLYRIFALGFADGSRWAIEYSQQVIKK